MRLPIIDFKKKWPVFAAGYVCFCILYTFTGHVHLRPPARLPLSPVDTAVPFMAWTVWIYISQFGFLVYCLWLLNDSVHISRTLYSMGLASLLSFSVFILYPTTFPRAPRNARGLTAEAFEWLYRLDSPSNCFPSLHVALGFLALSGVIAEKKRARWLALVWAALIWASTMTTKQHYFVDIVAGLGVGLLCRAAVGRAAFKSAALLTERARQSDPIAASEPTCSGEDLSEG
ncbi:MAG: phosphatase PAP2 family protein [Blastocatellia bacterium]|nr:phosphatase PAP2 family protein [Blastocatellia bacterium]